MSTVTFLLRAQARRSWVTWVGVGLVLAVTAGVAMASMAGARRTRQRISALLGHCGSPRHGGRAPFDPTGQISDPAVLERIADTFVADVRRLPQVRSVSVSRGTNALLPGPDRQCSDISLEDSCIEQSLML